MFHFCSDFSLEKFMFHFCSDFSLEKIMFHSCSAFSWKSSCSIPVLPSAWKSSSMWIFPLFGTSVPDWRGFDSQGTWLPKTTVKGRTMSDLCYILCRGTRFEPSFVSMLNVSMIQKYLFRFQSHSESF